jgi:hypothetical protein
VGEGKRSAGALWCVGCLQVAGCHHNCEWVGEHCGPRGGGGGLSAGILLHQRLARDAASNLDLCTE